MPRRLLLLMVIGVPLLVAGAIAFGWWYMAVGRNPLAGDLHHDFGIVALGDGPASVSHTFHLVNHTSRTVEITDARPSCGCTKASLSRTEVPPGEAVDVDVTLTLSSIVPRTTHVTLLIEGFGEESVWVRARGRRDTGLTIDQFRLPVRRDETRSLVIRAERWGHDDPPAAPVLHAPQGTEASFAGWELMVARDLDKGTPARWMGRVEVRLTGTMDRLAQLQVVLAGQKRSILLTEEEGTEGSGGATERRSGEGEE